MRKNIVWILITIVIVVGIGYGISNQVLSNNNRTLVETTVPTSTEAPQPAATQPAEKTASPAVITPNYKDTIYQVDGTQIQLVNGLSEIEAIPGAASKTVTQYFGNDAKGDLNGDDKEDVAFLLTQNKGGSGTFFYVVAALQTNTGYQGTNAVLLGDRIAPQTTTIENGMVVVNYADRKPEESFTIQPSVRFSTYFQVTDGKLMEVNVISQITNREWKWVSTQMNDGTVITPKIEDAFTITFKEDGSLIGKTDCNNFFGMVQVDGNKLTFDSFGSTKMACEASQEDVFMRFLGEVGSYLLESRTNTLILEIKLDSGIMKFK